METRKTNILIVENNPWDAYLLRETFKDHANGEFNLIRESGLTGAFERMAVEKIDLTILDLYLPETSGLETLQRVRNFDPGMPVIVLTSHFSAELASKAREMGASFCLPKDRPEMVALVKGLRENVSAKADL